MAIEEKQIIGTDILFFGSFHSWPGLSRFGKVVQEEISYLPQDINLVVNAVRDMRKNDTSKKICIVLVCSINIITDIVGDDHRCMVMGCNAPIKIHRLCNEIYHKDIYVLDRIKQVKNFVHRLKDTIINCDVLLTPIPFTKCVSYKDIENISHHELHSFAENNKTLHTIVVFSEMLQSSCHILEYHWKKILDMYYTYSFPQLLSHIQNYMYTRYCDQAIYFENPKSTTLALQNIPWQTFLVTFSVFYKAKLSKSLSKQLNINNVRKARMSRKRKRSEDPDDCGPQPKENAITNIANKLGIYKNDGQTNANISSTTEKQEDEKPKKKKFCRNIFWQSKRAAKKT